jgi:GH15 family glucan-1,4-alpha-glucosidase
VFEALLGRATGLGLYGEEMDPATGAHLGNFPQALTHAALVQAALALRDTPAEVQTAQDPRSAAVTD